MKTPREHLDIALGVLAVTLVILAFVLTVFAWKVLAT